MKMEAQRVMRLTRRSSGKTRERIVSETASTGRAATVAIACTARQIEQWKSVCPSGWKWRACTVTNKQKINIASSAALLRKRPLAN